MTIANKNLWENILDNQYSLFEEVFLLFQSSPETDSDYDDIRAFLSNGTLPNGDSLGATGLELFWYDESDPFMVILTDSVISSFCQEMIVYDRQYTYQVYYDVMVSTEFGYDTLPSTSGSIDIARDHFWGITGVTDGPVILYSARPENISRYELALKAFRYWANQRLDIIYNAYQEYGISEELWINIESEESKWAEEESEKVSEQVGANQVIELLAQKLAEERGITDLAAIDVIVTDAYGSRQLDTLGDFYNLFQTGRVNIDEIERFDSSHATNIYQKLVSTGLLELASYAFEISEFAKKRLQNKSTVFQNANQLIDDSIDLPWLLKLIDVKNNLQSDPIFFSQVIYYFPGLNDFFLTALSVITDYSNQGLGGGYEEQNRDLFLETLKQAFGDGKTEFTLASEFANTQKRIEAAIASSPYRSDTAPESPDIFHLRLGAANFYVPPVSINVNTRFKTGSMVGGALRQKNSPKFNSGYRETVVSLRLFFPNYQEIWGLSLDPDNSIDLSENFEINFNTSPDAEVDKFLSSLRGLVAAFKYSPIMPIKNHYLNTVHGITGVAMSSMSISTIPGYPFALAVDLELLNFNHKPFLPMIKDFNQAIHWGKYRQYMGKAAKSLHNYVNESFLLKTSDVKEENTSTETYEEQLENELTLADIYADLPEWVNNIPEADRLATIDSMFPELNVFGGTEETPSANSVNDTLSINVVDEWINGNHLTLYTPAETQTKLFLPDTSDFRSEQEEYMTDLGEAAWEQVLKTFGIDITNTAEFSEYGTTLSETINLSRNNEYKKSTYQLVVDSIDLLLAGQNAGSESEQYYDFIITDFILENSNKLDESREEWLKDWSATESGLNLSQYADEDSYYYKGNVLQDPSNNNLNLSQVKFFFWSISKDPRTVLDYLTGKVRRDYFNRNGVELDDDLAKEEVRNAFNVSLYERFFKSGTIQSLMEAARAASGNFTFNEWEVPMTRIDLDPNSVVIDGFYVTLGNNFSKMQVQMQDEPSYQHIGGRDSFIDIKMTVYGEKELIKMKRIFDHISALARLEHATGVIGFLGIKNIVTALAGVKYVMPLNYTVTTKPSFPHVYDVSLRLVDFDIFQQKREELSSKQQRDLITHFTTKKNPFLRIKQMWGSFNAYPDLPLSIKNTEGEVVGHLDPDYYFRSFEMFDDDVIYNFSTEQPRMQSFVFDDEEEMTNYEYAPGYTTGVYASDLIANKFKEYIETYNGENIDTIVELMANFVVDNGYTKNTVQRALQKLLSWLPNESGESQDNTNSVDVDGFDFDKGWNLLTEFINYRVDEDSETNPFFEEVNPGAFYSVGNIGPSNYSMKQKIEEALLGSLSLPNEEYVSFHPEQVDFHKIITLVPAMSPEDVREGKAPAILITAIGNYFGYLDNNNGRFYLTVGGSNVTVDENARQSLRPNPTKDVGTPDTGISQSDPPFSGIGTSVAKYQKAYDGDEYKHWEKMLVDTKYRDISGRMLRAFPTYMLWLIDEGGHFAGIKLFDNFYGLQSIIDFSVVSSEDLLGDTLIFRVSNMYSKLTTKESSDIFNANTERSDGDSLSLTDGLASVVDRTLNMSRNILGHMSNEYIVDINNIRLKPGVRVHLRGGYGSNPNSLQTLFNGIITNVEQGEIVTVTAQSDAIELGAMVNSTNKKGDSGKIDGGIDTGLWLSEPRDLMVRLLSMGSSRAREAIAMARGGTIFSENKFGIRHFGTTLYDPMTQQEQWMNQGKMDKMSNAFAAAGNGNYGTAGLNFTSYTMGLVSQLFTNTANDIDIEIFKRNIYPGNGTGMAQFLGGDLDDGWSTVSSIVDEDFNPRVSKDLADLTDISWNRLLSESQTGGASANVTLESLTEDNELNASGRGQVWSNILGGAASFAVGGAGLALGGPIATAVGLGGAGGLLGVMTGRSGQSLWRTMGVISPNADDDLPGFDEVSFRAQTYMRTVWDMFQICARLLPNYIVAVRPFEDRSTIFYGKPHWLYTSGVVPLTTGYTHNEAPAPISSDSALISMLNDLNSSTSALMDYAAFYQSDELNSNILSVADRVNAALEESLDADGQPINEYAPTTSLMNKVINFGDARGLEYLDGNGDILCKIPVSTGSVKIGMHLPIGNLSKKEDLLLVHRQIPNLPPRYGFPFFINAEPNSLAEGSSLWHMFEDEDYEDFKNKFQELREKEKQHLENTGQSLVNSETSLTLDDIDLDFSGIQTGDLVSSTGNAYMPYPARSYLASQTGLDSGSPGVYLLQNMYNAWGTPETASDEQFYIAMRWPLDFSQNEQFTNLNASDQQALGTFFSSRMDIPGQEVVSPEGAQLDRLSNGNANLDAYTHVNGMVSGSPGDYKQRKVLVYNSETGRAVVCKPAYALWSISRQSQTAAPGGNPSPDAVVSPDAAFYLGMLSPTRSVISGEYDEDGNGFTEVSKTAICSFTFVPDNVPVGVVDGRTARSTILPVSNTLAADSGQVIGFGHFRDGTEATTTQFPSGFESQRSAAANTINDYLGWYGTGLLDGSVSITDNLPYGGNPLFLSSAEDAAAGMVDASYFDAVVSGNYGLLTAENLYLTLDGEMPVTGPRYGSGVTSGSSSFAPVFSIFDEISIEARNYYDEDFNQQVSVIAGDGRTLIEAQEIWDQFRASYHTYDSVKAVFSDIYGMDPDSEIEMPPSLSRIISGEIVDVINKFKSSGGSAEDEFAILLGEDWTTNSIVVGDQYDPTTSGLNYDQVNGGQEAIEFVRESFIDAPISEGGLIESLNNFLINNLKKVNEIFFDSSFAKEIYGVQVSVNGDEEVVNYVAENIKTPKQLFLIMVGLFRQKMWSDPYARAWLVLRPDRKVWGSTRTEKWSFKPVDRIFRAYIDPYNDYAKKSDKFRQLLVATKAEGNSSSDIFSYAANGIGDFFDKNIAPMWSALTTGLSGLLNMYKLSMQQMGYALNQATDFRKHAHIMNKAFNDSIYYSLGREGSLLRAADNPFTREYGEPVVEIREPFQRIHYISSFSHILANQIQENINNVATTVTAVSDGKYPVTVALDKGAPAERQVEKTVETGLYFDNMVGEGFFGFLHPLMHPMETIRGVTKNATGTPDELSARRIALAHLKESIKDIYQGELMIIGNADIRPHDLVYLADVYERMYGIFEVEQVVHHFTSDMGFVTSITPNALVTVNDPARWYLSSWMHSWLSTQAIRNDTRLYIDSIRAGNAGIVVGSNVSLDRLADVLGPQMTGGIQFTHGSSALIKDAIALESAKHLPDSTNGITSGSAVGGTAVFSAIAGAIGGIAGRAALAAGTAATGGTAAVGIGVAAAIGANLGGQLAWKGWKWVRDNLLDQHGCYVQYLNRNGQPMDAGLSYNQGMAVGQYHSKALLPGILGVRTKTRTPEGYAYIRTDDLFKSLGWREKEIQDLNRYISLENALVHTRVLADAGVSPEKAGLEPQFKVLVKVTEFIDGDTIQVQDVLNPTNSFRVRFDAINTGETNTMNGQTKVEAGQDQALSGLITNPETGEVESVDIELLDMTTPGGKAKQYVYEALKDKVFILRVNKTREKDLIEGGAEFQDASVIEDYYEAGSPLNNKDMYVTGIFGRVLGTIFYHLPNEIIDSAKNEVEQIFRLEIDKGNLSSLESSVKESFKNQLGDLYSSDSSPVFNVKFDDIYTAVSSSTSIPYYFNYTSASDPLVGNTDEVTRNVFNILTYIQALQSLYRVASKWPQVAWDEYYDDGYPVTLNWELVVNNLARVYVRDLQTESESVNTAQKTAAQVEAVER